MPVWTICIASLHSRTALLAGLLEVLSGQVTLSGADVEILVDRDNGEDPIGVKRTRLLEAATGDYTCFVDDDDEVAAVYVERLLAAIGEGVDYVGFRVRFSVNGVYHKDSVHRLGQEWADTEKEYFRGITHLNPLRREIALTGLPFEDGFGEDHVWSVKIQDSGLAKTGTFVDEQLYFYDFRPERSVFYGGAKMCETDPGLPLFPHVRYLGARA